MSTSLAAQVRGFAEWSDFHGSFHCEPTNAGTVVTHVERFDFHRPFRWLTDPYLREWLRRDVTAEMNRLGKLLS